MHIALYHVNSGVSPSNSALSMDVSYICILLCCVALWTHTPWNGSSTHLKTHHHELSTGFVSESNFNRNRSEDLIQKGWRRITNTTLVSNFKWLRRKCRYKCPSTWNQRHLHSSHTYRCLFSATGFKNTRIQEQLDHRRWRHWRRNVG